MTPFFLINSAKTYSSSTDLLEPWCPAQNLYKDPGLFRRAILPEDKSETGVIIPGKTPGIRPPWQLLGKALLRQCFL